MSLLDIYACIGNVTAMRITLRPGVISEYCAAQGISRDELSRRMQVSTGTAFRVDTGRTEPSPKFIGALVSVTGRPFEELFIIEDAA